MQFFFPHSLGALRRSHFQCGKCEGRRSQSSEARTSLALPPRWARRSVTYSMCNMVDFCLYAAVFRVGHYADLVPGFFCIYSGTLCRSGSWVLLYLQWYTVPIWFLNSSVFIVERYANTATLQQFQDRTPRVRFRPLQGSYLFSYRLEVSARGRGYRFGLLRRRGDTTQVAGEGVIAAGSAV